MALPKPLWCYKPKHNQREREHRVCYGKRMVHTTQGQHKSRQKEMWYEPEMLDDEFPDTVQEFYNFFIEKPAPSLPKALLNQ